MVYVIACIVGLVAAVGITLLLVSLFPSLSKHVGVTIVLFLLCWGAMIGVCKYAWWIGVVLAVIAGIVYIIKRKKPLDMEKDINTMNQNQNKEENNTEE